MEFVTRDQHVLEIRAMLGKLLADKKQARAEKNSQE
jgi:hypothetical protein